MSTFPASNSLNRIAAVTLRVESNSLEHLENYYINKIGFKKIDELNQASKVSTLSLPQDIYSGTGHTSAVLKLNPVAKSGFSSGKTSDIYWKIGLQLHDVDSAAVKMGYAPGSQFKDIGYMRHIQDPAGFPIELLQTTFEANEKDRQSLFGEDDKNKYQQLMKEQFSDRRSSITGQQPLIIGQITIRISDDKKSLEFYQDILGMKLISIQDVSDYGFRLFFLVYTTDEPPHNDLNDVSIREWLWQRRYTQLELQWKFHSTKLTHNGYQSTDEDAVHLPSGLDSIQIEINDTSILNRVMKHDSFMPMPNKEQMALGADEDNHYVLGAIRDPDGCNIEIITSNKSTDKCPM